MKNEHRIMLNAFLKFVAHHKLIARNDKILLAVSGGIDSVVLTDLLKKSGFEFGVAHCNFQLRGSESDKDEEFVQQLCERLGVLCHIKKFDTASTAMEKGVSTQMAARERRYEWFAELLQSEKYDRLATAHHKNDNLETVLFNLIKGTGIAGLHGIKIVQGQVIRPLLFATRSEIDLYAELCNLNWREDSSNSSLKYRRNLIRNRIIPMLKEINPNLENTMEQTIHRINAVEEFLQAHVNIIKKQLLETRNGDVWISLEKLKEIPGLQAVLGEILKPYGFNFPQLIDILNALDDPQPGKKFYSNDFVLNIDRSHIIISDKNCIEKEVFINSDDEIIDTPEFSLKAEKLKTADFVLEKSSQFAFLDLDKLAFPLKVRKWMQGDKFVPLGMKGQKKLSDFMIDEKIPVNLKNKVYVILSNEEIVWVVGERIDDRYKITGTTKNILKISKVSHHVEFV